VWNQNWKFFIKVKNCPTLGGTGWYIVNHCGFRCGTGINEKLFLAHIPSFLHDAIVGCCFGTLAKTLNFSNHEYPWGMIVSSVMIST